MGNFNSIVPQVGIMELFQPGNRLRVENTILRLHKTGIKDVKIIVSWAEYETEEGKAWYEWLIPHLAEHFSILPCLMYTPSTKGLIPEINSPPSDDSSLAGFVEELLYSHGRHFEYVQLWDEPNNRGEYDYTLDESYAIFTSMIIKAAEVVRSSGMKTVLGGISPIDPGLIKRMGDKKVLEHIDVVGIHGFPDVFDSHWRSWEESIDTIRRALDLYNSSAEIWITKTGYSTWRYDDRVQVDKFIKVLSAPVQKVYWYALNDIPYNSSSVNNNDERQYHFGMVGEDGSEKLLYRLLSTGGLSNVIKNKWMTSDIKRKSHESEAVLITGGAGFIGTNLAKRLIASGYHVYIFDNLSRHGVESNLEWLKRQYPDRFNIIIADVRDQFAVEDAVSRVSHVFHLAAQVAVTTSLVNPAHDYSVNVRGTVNLLEAIRKSSNRPSLIFTSTNKVYGNLGDLVIRKNATRYLSGELLNQTGINEMRRLDFQSPYGSSKGAADQYVLDYARSFGLRNVVFRMSCIYGEHQFGTEDQGWVAHFILKALRGEELVIYGDGMQVRDALFAEDLVEAFLLAWENIDEFHGEAFNIGGGAENSISLLEMISMLENLLGRTITKRFKEWRQGDQKYYISDTSKFSDATGWKPAIPVKEGIRILYDWLSDFINPGLSVAPVIEGLHQH